MATVEAFSLSPVLKDEISALVKAGIYASKSDVAKDAFRCLLEHQPSLKVNAAIEMYKDGRVTLSRAAEIAGVSFFEFKDILIDRGIKIETPGGSKKELDKGVELIKKIRNRK